MEDPSSLKSNLKWPLGGFIGIMLAVIAIFMIVPLFTRSFYSHLFLQGCFTLLILSTIYTMSSEKLLALVGLVFVVCFLFFDALSILQNSLSFMLVAYAIYSVFLFFAIVMLIRGLLRAREINTNLVFGVITAYFLIGILWAKLYFLIDLCCPNSFHNIVSLNLAVDGLEKAYENLFDLLYYSFCTLSTLGLGDISPVASICKSLTMLEAIFGQLFVATFISKMVSVWREPLT